MNLAQTSAGWPSFFRCATSMAMIGASSGLLWPLFAVRLKDEGFAEGFIGASASAQAVAFIIAFPLIARAHRWVGPAHLCAASAIVAGLCLGAIGWSSAPAWFLGRLGLGAGISVLTVMCETKFMAEMPSARFGLLIGLFGFIWSLAFASGPLLLLLVGFDGWAPLIVPMALIAGAAGLLLTPASGRESQPWAQETGQSSWSFSAIASVLPAVLFLALCQGLLDSTHDTFVPLYGLARGLDERHAVSLLSILLFGIALAQIPTGALVDRYGHRKVLAAMGLAIAASALSLPGATGLHAMSVCAFALGMGAGGLWTASAAQVKAEASAASLGAVNSCRTFCYGLGSFSGPLLAGAIASHFSPGAIPYLIGAIGLMSLAGPLWRARQAVLRADLTGE